MDKNELATLTKFKYFEAFNTNNLMPSRIKRTAALLDATLFNTAFVRYLDEGYWFISLLNDNKHPIRFQLRTEYYGISFKFDLIFFKNFKIIKIIKMIRKRCL